MGGFISKIYYTKCTRRVENFTKSIDQEEGVFADGGKILKNNKRDPSFIREMRVHTYGWLLSLNEQMQSPNLNLLLNCTVQ